MLFNEQQLERFSNPPPKYQTADTSRKDNWTTEAHAHSKGLAKVAVQWLIKQLCFVFATFAKPRNVGRSTGFHEE